MKIYETDKYLMEALSLPIKLQNEFLKSFLEEKLKNQSLGLNWGINNDLKYILDRIDLGDLTGKDYNILSKNFWVIPFELSYKSISNLENLSNKQFDSVMLKHFNNSRIKRLFKTCISSEKNIDKKRLLRQIQKNYFQKNFAVCSTCLTTYLDGLNLKLIDNNSTYQHKAHNAIENLKQYYDEEVPHYNKGYEMFIKIALINNFYENWYSNDYNLKDESCNDINRNLNSHGSKYSNEKIYTIKLLNAIWFVNDVIESSNMKENFRTSKRNITLIK